MAKCNELYNGLFKKDNRSPPSYPAFSYFCVILILDRSIYQIEMKRKKKILTIIVLAVTILIFILPAIGFSILNWGVLPPEKLTATF